MIQVITYMTYWFYRSKYWPKETIPPNMHMLEDHAADFIERSSPGHGVNGEHGAESIHKIFRFLQEHNAQCNQPRYVCRVC